LKLGRGGLGLITVNKTAAANPAAINASWTSIRGLLIEVAVIGDPGRQTSIRG
jgi:hypothetical protein